MAYSFTNRTVYPTFDDLAKPMAYLREREDNNEKAIYETEAKNNMYKHYIDNIRSKDPNHTLVKQFDNIQNQLSTSADELVGSAVDPNYAKRLYKINSQFTQFAAPLEESINRYKEYQSTAAKYGNNFVYAPGYAPDEVGVQNFYDNGALVAPKGAEGDFLYKSTAQTMSSLAEGLKNTSWGAAGKSGFVKLITNQGFKPEVLEKIQTVITTGDDSLLNDLGLNKTDLDLVKYAVNSMRQSIQSQGIDFNDPNYVARALPFINKGITDGGLMKKDSQIMGDPNRNKKDITLQEEMTTTMYAQQVKSLAGFIEPGVTFDSKGVPQFQKADSWARYTNEVTKLSKSSTDNTKPIGPPQPVSIKTAYSTPVIYKYDQNYNPKNISSDHIDAIRNSIVSILSSQATPATDKTITIPNQKLGELGVWDLRMTNEGFRVFQTPGADSPSERPTDKMTFSANPNLGEQGNMYNLNDLYILPQSSAKNLELPALPKGESYIVVPRQKNSKQTTTGNYAIIRVPIATYDLTLQ